MIPIYPLVLALKGLLLHMKRPFNFATQLIWPAIFLEIKGKKQKKWHIDSKQLLQTSCMLQKGYFPAINEWQVKHNA